MACCSSNKGPSNPFASKPANPIGALMLQATKASNYVMETNLVILNGCLCATQYLYLEFPNCVGLGCNLDICCVESTCCLRPNTRRLACICCEARCSRGMQASCRGQLHTCCLVKGCACPPGQGEPVIAAALGVVLYPSCGICMQQQNVMIRM